MKTRELAFKGLKPGHVLEFLDQLLLVVETKTCKGYTEFRLVDLATGFEESTEFPANLKCWERGFEVLT